MDFLNPFTYLGSAAGKVVADGWTAAMLGLWNAGLWLLKLVLTIVDAFTVPDLREGGPGAQVYQITFWIAGAVMLLLAMVQLGSTATRRDGKSMARVLLGTGQFIMVWACWIALAVLVVAACGGLTRALMSTLLHIDKWSQFDPLGTPISTNDISDGTVATVLGFLGIFMVLAAIGHLLVMLTRAAALMVLAATTPIAAAGLVSDAGQSWFWKSLRWFIAAAFTPVVMILVLGIGVQMASGVATGMTDNLQRAIGTAVPGVVLICIGCFSPLALFKLLAFVDPGTSSGSALRAGLATQGGISGLLGGQGQGGSAAASSIDANGRSQGESSGEDATSARFNSGARGLIGQLGGALGQAAGAGMGAMESIGSRGAAVAADVTNQMGVGHNNYVPDFSKTKQGSSQSRAGNKQADDDNNPEINGAGPTTTPDPAIHPPATPGTGPTPAPTAAPGGAGATGGAGAAGGEAAGAAAAVPIVPV
jgi:hypothetical protein